MTPRKKKKRPSPDELLAEIRGKAPAKTYAFGDYMEAIDAMQKKGFSYAKTAEFLSERLGYPITRGQVYRAYQLWLEVQRQHEEDQARNESLAKQSPFDFDPEEYEQEKAERAMTAAAEDLLRYALDKYPQGSLPCETKDVFKRVVAMFDEDVRNDFAAEQADKQLKSNNDHERNAL